MKVAFGTRLEPDLRQRVKIYAAATDRTIEDVVSEAIDGYLSEAARSADVSAEDCLLIPEVSAAELNEAVA